MGGCRIRRRLLFRACSMYVCMYLVAGTAEVTNRLSVALVVELFDVRAPAFFPVLSGHEDGAQAGAVLEATLSTKRTEETFSEEGGWGSGQ